MSRDRELTKGLADNDPQDRQNLSSSKGFMYVLTHEYAGGSVDAMPIPFEKPHVHLPRLGSPTPSSETLEGKSIDSACESGREPPWFVCIHAHFGGEPTSHGSWLPRVARGSDGMPPASGGDREVMCMGSSSVEGFPSDGRLAPKILSLSQTASERSSGSSPGT
jgi:hypothetical protein